MTIPMVIAIAALLVAGVIGCCCVPALPGGYPQRRFDLYSWVTAMEGDGLKMERVQREGGQIGPEASHEEDRYVGGGGWRPAMPLEEVEKEFGSLRLRIPASNNA
jgi:hypothetical protein